MTKDNLDIQAIFEDKNFKYSLELKQEGNTIFLNEKQIDNIIKYYNNFKIK